MSAALPTPSMSVTKPKPKATPRRCGQCGDTSHTKRTCPEIDRNAPVVKFFIDNYCASEYYSCLGFDWNATGDDEDMVVDIDTTATTKEELVEFILQKWMEGDEKFNFCFQLFCGALNNDPEIDEADCYDEIPEKKKTPVLKEILKTLSDRKNINVFLKSFGASGSFPIIFLKYGEQYDAYTVEFLQRALKAMEEKDGEPFDLSEYK